MEFLGRKHFTLHNSNASIHVSRLDGWQPVDQRTSSQAVPGTAVNQATPTEALGIPLVLGYNQIVGYTLPIHCHLGASTNHGLTNGYRNIRYPIPWSLLTSPAPCLRMTRTKVCFFDRVMRLAFCYGPI